MAFAMSAYYYYQLAQLAKLVYSQRYVFVPHTGAVYASAYYKPLANALNRKQLVWSLIFGITYFSYARFDLTLKAIEFIRAPRLRPKRRGGGDGDERWWIIQTTCPQMDS